MTLTKTLIAPALLAALAAAMPAQAATFTNGNELRRDISQLDRRVDQARDRHLLSAREASYLNSQVRNLDQTWRVYSRGGFSDGERRNLTAQITRVQRDLDRQARDANNRTPHRR